MPTCILLTGGPSTGKTTLINHLKSMGHYCLDEISREVIKKAQEEGIKQLFLEEPLRFSTLLKEARVKQLQEAASLQYNYVFLDRGIPDTVAYMEYLGQAYPISFVEACKSYRYDKVFVLPPWEEIHRTDNERYENFNEAKAIHKALLETYYSFSYHPIVVPRAPVAERANFIISKLDHN